MPGKVKRHTARIVGQSKAISSNINENWRWATKAVPIEENIALLAAPHQVLIREITSFAPRSREMTRAIFRTPSPAVAIALINIVLIAARINPVRCTEPRTAGARITMETVATVRAWAPFFATIRSRGWRRSWRRSWRWFRGRRCCRARNNYILCSRLLSQCT